MDRPVVLVGCGRLGSALVEGWMRAGPVTPADLIILTPSDKPVAEAARAAGARINPEPEALAQARVVVLAVKPAAWRTAADALRGKLARDAVVVSLMAGVDAASIADVLDRPVARVMPTTAVAQARGVAAVWAQDATGRFIAAELFRSVAEVVDLADEELMDAATATAGSAPAFILDYVQALAAAGQAQGLDPAAALALARGALRSAAAGAAGDATLDALIARVASPGGTTRAGLDASHQAVMDAARAAIDAAVRRAGELGSESQST
ncbi:MAG TPA: pyrroline-5-carboxylate reductase dimerization domain-containing protein [Brevundimonas sp.]|jgi:pyrroline-5-carboxylate reductase|uniref:pyrroline-5-carboxylate reductase family protein n=1 Tax=Brevundimonas sp. TaxID=1871086 RepID=UPI002DEE9C9C|nr:pyrroline-5-carboxylate reductase dimerization domain-containing protein [Brevundimonas sp.]